MQAPLYNQEAKDIGKIELEDAVFGVRWNGALVKQVVDAERANRQQPIAHTKIRQEVRGGGKKPWKQKGTGRARHGSTRSPLWKGGGTTFGPRNEKNFEKKINKKMRRGALLAVISAKVRDGECVFVDAIALAAPKTKEFAGVLKHFAQFAKGTVALVNHRDATLERAARNIKNVRIMDAKGLNAHDLLQVRHLLMPKKSVATIVETFGKKS